MIKKIIIGIGLLGFFIYVYNYYQINFIRVEKKVIKSFKFKVGEELKILQISDMHNRVFPNNNRKLYKKIKDLNPDIIVITGDLIDGKTKDFTYIYSFIEDLLKINKNIYYVSGNHEWRTGRIKYFISGLNSRKVNVINNKNRIFLKGDLRINICGIDDPYTLRGDLESAFYNINEKFYTILLAHSPGIAIKKEDIKSDLILSGHTHGGQVRLPIIGPIVAPGQGLFPKYDRGLFKVNNNLLYIDSGLGTSTLPIRFLNRSQISLIKIIS